MSCWTVRRLPALDDAHVDELAEVLIDCVEGGASVSFMHPLTRERAVAFWRRVAEGVARGERALLIAQDAEGVCGTVQLVLDLPENRGNRAGRQSAVARLRLAAGGRDRAIGAVARSSAATPRRRR